MRCCRISLRLFLLGSLSIVAIILGLWLLVDQTWLAHLSTALRQSLCIATSLTASLAVIIWSGFTLSKCSRQGESTEVKFRTLLECAPDALLIMDREGRIVLVNRRAEEMFGYQRGELLGKPAEKLVRKQAR